MAGSSSAVTMSRYQDNVRRTAPAASSRIPVSQRRDEARHVSAPHRSRLLMMQESFQKKLMKEKEEKMLAIYQRQNEQGLQKVQRYNSQEGNSQGIVRDFFRERREMEQSQNSSNVISRDTHFQQKLKAKRKASSLASDVESINSQNKEVANKHPHDEQRRLEKNKEQEMQNYLTKQQRYQQQPTGKAAKGVIRSNPLAPIKRESMKNKTQNASSSYDHFETSENLPNDSDDDDGDYSMKPISKPQKVSRHLTKQKTDFSDSSDNPYRGGHLQGNHNRQPQQQKPMNSRKVAPPIARGKSNQRKPPKEKLSDFQKWQQEQDLERQERLKKYDENAKPKTDYTVDYDRELEQEMNSAKERRKKEYEDMMAKERELENLIARHKKDLEKMEEDNSSDEEDSFTPRKPLPKAAPKKASRVSSKIAEEDPYEDAGYSPYNNDDYESRAGEFKSRQRQALQTKPKAKPKPKVKEQEDFAPYKPPSPVYHVTSFYEQAGGEDEEMVDIDLEECPVCGRRFASDRLAKHAVVCKKASKKKRKVFDMTKQRTEGTEVAQYVKHGQHLKNEPKTKPSNWKRKHEEFIRSIRDARQTQAYVARGGNLADLPPPPPSENPDYKQCPYCERRFNPDTAARHIPKCKDIKSRPKPPRRK
ncbi:uncharacterized protein [Diadema antillarum]|uniref:uncharacterized protein n=1 Tax=Diadema antillarum TaxID=105358 RepID=UPI003A8836D8